jgi:iron complex outermembrane receptor protein
LHSESFNPNSAAASAAFGFYVKPQSGVSDEAGVRLALMQSRIALEASVYKITVTDVVQTNPFGNVGIVPPIPGNNFAFVPGITNKGFDLTAKVNLVNSLQLTGSYTHTEATYAAGPVQLALGVTSYPVNNQPEDQFAVFAKYSLPGEYLKGFHVTAGYNWTGRRPGGAVGALPAFYLNPYGIVNVGVGYTRGRWSYNLMVKNLTDVYAFRSAPTATRLYPEEPRQATFSIRAKF